MKLLKTSAVILAATAAAAAAMLATPAIDGVRPSKAAPMGRDHEAGPGSRAPDSRMPGVADARGASQAPLPQDYRASLFALQTGRMTFGQLWFSAAR